MRRPAHRSGPIRSILLFRASAAVRRMAMVISTRSGDHMGAMCCTPSMPRRDNRCNPSAAKAGSLLLNEVLKFKYPEKDAVGYRLVGPPAYLNGMLYVGLAQSERHIPGGLVAAMDAKTGAVKWVFSTIPQTPTDDGWEIAKDSWIGGQRVGGGIWTQPAIDPELGLIYFNAGNPSPDYEGTARHGMNLFTNSILALRLDTGKLAWYYQTIHHDLWDWDLVTGPVLFDVNVGGKTIKGVALGREELLLVSVQSRDRPADQSDCRDRGAHDRPTSLGAGLADAAVSRTRRKACR